MDETKSKRISKVLTGPKDTLSGFRKFIHNYGVLPLAIGVVIGNAVNDLVKTLVDGLVTPLISLISPQGELQNFQVTFHGAVFKFGMVLNACLSFIAIAAIVYFVLVVLLRQQEILDKK